MQAFSRRFLPFVLGGASCSFTLLPVVGERPSATEHEARPDQHTANELTSLWTRKRGSDWPRFLGPAGNGQSSETGLLVPWPRQGPRIVWQRRIGSGYGIGSVSQGRYYHFDRWDDAGSGGRRGAARLSCLNAETGDELWRFEFPTSYRDLLGYNGGPRASPIIDGDRVYVFGAEGLLHCVRASDGQPIWQVDTQTKYGVVQNFFGTGSSPLVVGDLLICMVGGSPAGSPGLYESGGSVVGNGSGIVAFNKYTGAEQYRITDELASYTSPQRATIDGRAWCFVWARGGLVGFEPVSGKVDFHYPWRARLLESVNASTPVVVGNRVFLSEAYQVGSSLLSVRPGGYDVVWSDDLRRRDKAMRTHWNTPIHVEGYLYGSSGRHTQDAELRCIEWHTGRVMWSEPGELPERSSLLYVDGHFVCLGEFGTLQLIKADPQKCHVVSHAVLRDAEGRPLLEYPCWAAPILAHGLLYVRGDERLVCLELIPDADAKGR